MKTHPRTRVAGLVLLALAGLAVAVALSVAASTLSRQPIGLSGEPLRAGQTLAPAIEPAKTPARATPAERRVHQDAKARGRKAQRPHVVTVTQTTPVPVTAGPGAPAVTSTTTTSRRSDDYPGKRDRDD